MNNSELTQEQKAANAETWEHINNVMKLLAVMQWELSKRMFTHDRSKLRSPEVSVFTELSPKLAGSTYGSEEYQGFLVEMKPALDHHYSHNRHHPEFFQENDKHAKEITRLENLANALGQIQELYPDDAYAFGGAIDIIEAQKRSLQSGVSRMNVVDLIEMLVDWKAASMRHENGDVNRSIEISAKRFNFSPQLKAIFENSIPLLEDVFKSLETQRDI